MYRRNTHTGACGYTCGVVCDEDMHVPVWNTMEYKLQARQARETTREMEKGKNLYVYICVYSQKGV